MVGLGCTIRMLRLSTAKSTSNRLVLGYCWQCCVGLHACRDDVRFDAMMQIARLAAVLRFTITRRKMTAGRCLDAVDDKQGGRAASDAAPLCQVRHDTVHGLHLRRQGDALALLFLHT